MPSTSLYIFTYFNIWITGFIASTNYDNFNLKNIKKSNLLCVNVENTCNLVSVYMFVFCKCFWLISYILHCSVPSASPKNLSVIERSPTSITVKWQPIPENVTNGKLSGYKIRYRKFLIISSGVYAYLTTNWSLNSLPQAKITDLENSTLYQISIAGYTDGGIGPYSDIITVKTKKCEFLKIYFCIENTRQFFIRHCNTYSWLMHCIWKLTEHTSSTMMMRMISFMIMMSTLEVSFKQSHP